jgi:hypothetical protein
MSSDMLGEIVNTLQELRRMHQLNFELLEQLNVARACLLQNQISLPNQERLASLLSKATTPLGEINTRLPSDEFLQHKKSDKDLTEPYHRLALYTSGSGLAYARFLFINRLGL